MIEYTIVGGFLGAGKTSFINGMLATASEQIAVIVNDLGELNIDAALIRNATDDTIELTNGCVCCSSGDSLAATLRALCERDPQPERIVVECSGAADPGQVARYGSRRVLAEPSIVVVADASDVRARANDRRFTELVRAQLTSADALVLSKTDLVPAEKVDALTGWLLRQTPAPVVAGRPTEFGAFGSTWTRAASGHLPEPTNDRSLFRTRTEPIEPGMSTAAIEQLLQRMEGLVRAKGVVTTAAGLMLVQWAAGRFEATPTSTAHQLPSQLVVITAG